MTNAWLRALDAEARRTVAHWARSGEVVPPEVRAAVARTWPVEAAAGGEAPFRSVRPLSASGAGLEPLTARRYYHPDVRGRGVVRLVPLTLMPAADADARTAGATLLDAEPVGLVPADEGGFPGWVLVHAPADGEAALRHTEQFHDALAGHGDAARRVERVARLLDGHPRAVVSLLDHAVRLLRPREGKGSDSARLFTRARAVERENGLPTDDDAMLRGVGMLNEKTLRAYAAELLERPEPKAAYEAFAALVEGRIELGIAPGNGTPQLLRRLGKAAGVEPDAVDDALLSQLPHALLQALSRSIWTLLGGAVARAVPARPALVWLQPRGDGTAAFDQWWLRLLLECGGLDGVGAEGVGRPAGWLTRWLSTHAVTPALDDVLDLFEGRLLADGVPSTVPARLGLVDRLLAARVPFRCRIPPQGFDVDGWLRSSPRLPLAAVPAHPRYGPPLRAGVEAFLANGGTVDRLDEAGLGVPADEWIAEHLRPSVSEPELTTLVTRSTGPRAFVERRELYDGLVAAAASPALRAALAERGPCGPTGAPTRPVTDDEVYPAVADLGLARRRDLLAESGQVGRAIAAAAAFFSPGRVPPADVPTVVAWPLLLRQAPALALRAVSPVIGASGRESLLALLEQWASTPFAADPAGYRLGVLPAWDDERYHDTPFGRLLVFDADDRSYVLAEGDALPARAAEVSVGVAWATAGNLRRFVELARERGPVPLEPAEVIAARTGLGRAAAALLWSGRPRLDARVRAARRPWAFPLAGVAKLLGVTSAELAAGIGATKGEPPLGAALGGDPAELWESTAPAERLAAAWVAEHGRVIALAPGLVTAARARFPGVDVEALLRAVRVPGDAPLLRSPARYRLEGAQVRTDGAPALTLDELRRLVGLCTWLVNEWPVGDPVRAGVPATIAALQAKLAAPEALMSCAGAGVVRPALLRDGLPPGARATEGVEIVPLLFAEAGVVLAERVTDTPVPDGRFEADPTRSVPELVERVAARHGLPADAAALYLQLLALPDPTDQNVRRWNGWTAARHRNAAGRLAGTGLVTSGKRPRAGRTLFLPGPWSAAKAPGRPTEEWKLALCPHPIDPAHVLFARAWERVSASS